MKKEHRLSKIKSHGDWTHKKRTKGFVDSLRRNTSSLSWTKNRLSYKLNGLLDTLTPRPQAGALFSQAAYGAMRSRILFLFTGIDNNLRV